MIISRFYRGLGVAARVHEYVKLSGVPMNVRENLDTPVNIHHLDYLLCVEDSWVQDLARIQPASVQIDAEQ